MKEYINEVSKDFDSCIALEKDLLILYIISLILSLILCFIFNNVICTLLILVHVFYIAIDTFNDIILKNYAENERRKTLLSNSFNSNLTEKKTKGYYNNNEKEPIKKMGINTFESVFFSKSNLELMVKSSSIKFILEMMVWLVLILIAKDKNLILCVTQCIFSTEILVNYLKLIYFNIKVTKIYDDFYKLFITERYSINTEPLLMEYVFEYECLKSYSHILLSDSNFRINNTEWSKEWNQISKEIK